jgi:urease subunit alpha
MFASLGKAISRTSVTFVSRVALELGLGRRLRLDRRLVAVKNCRTVQKRDMVLNDLTPHIEVDSQTYEVRADGQLLVCDPLKELPLAQRYFLF